MFVRLWRLSNECGTKACGTLLPTALLSCRLTCLSTNTVQTWRRHLPDAEDSASQPHVCRRNHEWSVTCCPGGTCRLALPGRDGFIGFSIFSRRCHCCRCHCCRHCCGGNFCLLVWRRLHVVGAPDGRRRASRAAQRVAGSSGHAWRLWRGAAVNSAAPFCIQVQCLLWQQCISLNLPFTSRSVQPVMATSQQTACMYTTASAVRALLCFGNKMFPTRGTAHQHQPHKVVARRRQRRQRRAATCERLSQLLQLAGGGAGVS